MELSAPGHLTAIIDSGTSLITGPFQQVRAIAEHFGSNDASMIEDLYKIDCSKVAALPTIDFVINEQSYSLTPHDYILEDGTTCVLTLQGDPNSQVCMYMSECIRAEVDTENDSDRIA